MPRNIQQVIAWTRDPANRDRHQGGNWHNRCQQYINNGGDFNSSFDTAWLAAQASGPLVKSLDGITDGAVGYWRGVWIDGEECGHDAFWYQGVWWMASDACGEARPGQGEMVGNGTGWITATEYARLRPAAIWQGWSLRHGTETLAGANLAGLNLNDLPTLEGVSLMAAPNLFHLVTTGGDQAFIYQGLASQQIIPDAFAVAIEKGYGIKRVQVNEYDWNAITQTFSTDLAALASAIGSKPANGLTASEIAKAVNDDAADRLRG